MVGPLGAGRRHLLRAAGWSAVWMRFASAGARHTEAQAAWDDQVARGRLVPVAALL